MSKTYIGRRGGVSVLGLALALAAGAQVIAPAALAQDADSKTDLSAEDNGAVSQLSLGKIVVSTGVDKVAIDTPQSVTTLDQEDIDNAQASTIGDLLEGIPGVSAVGGVSGLGQGFNIRGMGTGVADSDSRILINVDGVSKFFEQYRMGGFFSEPELYKRVEVLRGPSSSTLYGAGALAGVINFQTKDASDFLRGDDRLSVRVKGSGETNADARAGSVIIAGRPSDNLDVLFSLSSRVSDDYKDGNGNVVVPSKAEGDSVLAKARYYVGGDKKHSVWASAEKWQNDSYQVYDQAEAFATTPVRRKTVNESYIVGYDNAFEGNDWLDVKAQLAYSNMQVDQTDNAGFSPNTVGYNSSYIYKTVQGRLENTSTFTFGPDWNAFVTTGLQTYKQERRNPRYRQDGTYINPGATTHPEGDLTRYSAFIQGEFIWKEKLTIIPGVRVDRVKLESEKLIATGTKPDTVKDTGVSPKIAVLYSLNDNFNLFGSVSRTVRMPVLDEVYSATTAQPANLTLKNEESDNIEVGGALAFDSLFADRDKFHAKLTVFRNDVDNLIARGTTGSPYFRNFGKARFEGVELEAEYATRSFFTRAALSLVDGDDRSGAKAIPLNTIPADELTLNAGYVIPSWNLTLGWRGEFAKEAHKYNVTTGAVTSTTDDYNIHSLYAVWKPQGETVLRDVDVRLSVDNVGDEYFRRHLSSLPAEGRTVKLSVGKTF
ncbi:TonB-dependent receptor domain-containing protein [Asticcacaulis machinosus]|uniref:TonB-dependent receptor n=1 Tax=Asticcacaulis machinosus TaxID=2984211 RepID=A0ABT5HFM2_9CAUL|nr:TonB-dependent receptor [Asticcacaulis machinosus]MDC7675050.1 TonB-dependent receptor [Asticcacaulis machinosus]